MTMNIARGLRGTYLASGLSQVVTDLCVADLLSLSGLTNGPTGIVGTHKRLFENECRLERKGKPYSLAAIRKRRARLANESAAS